MSGDPRERWHECPAPPCQLRVPHDQLACRAHWYSLPKPLRDSVWASYRSRDRDNGAAHRAAVREAVAFLRGEQQEAPASG